MHVQIWGRPLQRKFLVIMVCHLLLCFVQKLVGRNAMKLKKSCICHVRWSGCCRFCDRLGRAQRGREKEAGGSRAASAAPAGRVRRRTCSGVRNQGRHELHLSQCLLGRERRRESCQAGCMQRGQDGRRQEKVKEEEGVIRNSVLDARAAAQAAARFHFAP